MAKESLVDRKFDASTNLAKELAARHAPLLAAFWDYDNDWDRWKLVLVPRSLSEERRLVDIASNLLIEPPYRSVFSMSDPVVDFQIDRARALGDYIRIEPYVGRRFDTTFTSGQYFESVIPVYLAPELMTHLSPV